MANYKPSRSPSRTCTPSIRFGGLTKIDPQETINFWKMVRDEVQWRADNQIAAVGNERYRGLKRTRRSGIS
jgi:hypothetical protein